MPITIRDVARRLKLSITTVSRALDGYPDVAETTRQRVQQMAAQMGYTASRAARQLRRRRADAIGYIMSTSQPRFSDPFFSDFVSGVGDEAAAHRLELLLAVAPADTADEMQAYQRWVQGRRVDGIILTRTRVKDPRVRLLSTAGFPFAAFGRTRQRLGFPYVDIDNEAGARLLVKHILMHGFRRIAFIGAPLDYTFHVQRLAGYTAALAQARLRPDDSLVVTGDLTLAGGYRAALELLQSRRPPTAIIGVNDLTALGALAAAEELGLKVGQAVAIAGFDGIVDGEHSRPPLTTVRQPVYDIARLTTRLLVAQLSGDTVPQRHVLMPPELIIRGSTGA
jgi:LacI family transcriptional regulator